MIVIENIGSLVTMIPHAASTLGEIHDAELVIDGESIVYAGPKRHDVHHDQATKIDAAGAVVLPGLIDCHTHLLFAGSRADEFARRMNHESYQAIMAKGGGIASTAQAFSMASDEHLLKLAQQRLDTMLSLGTTTVEAKSGYGLSFAQEMRTLRLLKLLDHQHSMDIHRTFLGAHALPKEFALERGRYVALVIDMLSEIKSESLATDCDVFCETGAFTVEEAHTILRKAHDVGFNLKAHVQQLAPSGGVSLLKDLPLRSISHVDYVQDNDVEIIAQSGVVVEALPFATLFLRSQQRTPVQLLRAHEIPVALATDFNPGSAMCNDLMLAARLGVVYGGFSPNDALVGITTSAARALGYNDRGIIKAGALADLVITNCTSVNEIFYDWTKHPVSQVIKRGISVS